MWRLSYSLLSPIRKQYISIATPIIILMKKVIHVNIIARITLQEFSISYSQSLALLSHKVTMLSFFLTLPGCFSLRGNLSDIEFVEFSHVVRGDIGLFKDLGLSLVNLFSFIAKQKNPTFDPCNISCKSLVPTKMSSHLLGWWLMVTLTHVICFKRAGNTLHYLLIGVC